MTGKNLLLLASLCIALSACGLDKETRFDEANHYSDALFTLGKLASVELEMPEKTWQDIVGKASDKKYYNCSVTINGERLDNVAIRTKGASSLDDVAMMKSDRYSFTLN